MRSRSLWSPTWNSSPYLVTAVPMVWVYLSMPFSNGATMPAMVFFPTPESPRRHTFFKRSRRLTGGGRFSGAGAPPLLPLLSPGGRAFAAPAPGQHPDEVLAREDADQDALRVDHREAPYPAVDHQGRLLL